MEEYFGTLSVGGMLGLIVVITQYVKTKFNLQDMAAEMLSLGLNYLLLGSLHILLFFQAHPDGYSRVDLGFAILGLVVYPLFGWLTTSGVYVKIVKPAIVAQSLKRLEAQK